MGLVLTIMALLLWGTLNGITAFKATVKTFDSKLLELKKAEELRGAVKGLLARNARLDAETNELNNRTREARAALRAYRDQLQETIDAGRDPESGHQEKEELKA